MPRAGSRQQIHHWRAGRTAPTLELREGFESWRLASNSACAETFSAYRLIVIVCQRLRRSYCVDVRGARDAICSTHFS